jgi:hypothetical protein
MCGGWGGGVLEGVSDMKQGQSVGGITANNVPAVRRHSPGACSSLVVRARQVFEFSSGFESVFMPVIAIMSA